MTKMHKRRKIYNIKKKFQTWFITSFCFLFILESASIGIVLYYLLNKALSEALFVSHLKVRTTGEIVVPILLHANTSIAVLIILVAVVFFLVSVRRIEKKLFAFKEASEKVVNGDLTVRVSPQPSALTDRLTNCFNDATINLQKTLGSANDELIKIETELEDMYKLLSGESRNKEVFNNAFKLIDNKVKSLEEKLSKLTV